MRFGHPWNTKSDIFPWGTPFQKYQFWFSLDAQTSYFCHNVPIFVNYIYLFLCTYFYIILTQAITYLTVKIEVKIFVKTVTSKV